ncbi:hypothetical protein FLK61_39595 [Paenalkalicoccus suaedae]|uniref:Uncharacterized protein n=1 Tax=Paenalkalicoccus suaedae TaxID=2592382 RepID=A0A859FIL1_9BACI|nr:hypothetical protein [Paenalkalicoccus suaedae]QKS72720.1 hypothetical protein FLK61_39595 [Paenalkalicoccus suaedae]
MCIRREVIRYQLEVTHKLGEVRRKLPEQTWNDRRTAWKLNFTDQLSLINERFLEKKLKQADSEDIRRQSMGERGL